MNKAIKIMNYDFKGNQIDPKQLTIRDKMIYELIRKYIKKETYNKNAPLS